MARRKIPKRRLGHITIYIRKDFKPIFDEFVSMIERDPRFDSIKTVRGKPGIISPAIMQLMIKYVKEGRMNLPPKEAVVSNEDEDEDEVEDE